MTDRIGRGADKSDVRRFADFGEVRVLGKETVAGMNGVNVRDFGGTDHLRNIQVAVAGARRADADGFIGEAHVERIAVGFGIDRDGLDAQFPARGHDAQGNFTAIGDQNFSKHEIRSGPVHFLRWVRMPKATRRIPPAVRFQQRCARSRPRRRIRFRSSASSLR